MTHGAILNGINESKNNPIDLRNLVYIFGVAHVIPFNLNRTFQNKSKFLYSSLPLNIFSLFPVISDVADIEYSV